ncbi:MAG: NADH-quinone oxidoreductase subunit C [Candidatus Omnitrophota bacterium]
MSGNSVNIYNAKARESCEIPLLTLSEFRDRAVQGTKNGARIVSFFVYQEAGARRLLMALAHDQEGYLSVFSAPVNGSYESLTGQIPQANWFEREIFETWGIRPEGHPWLKPIRFQDAAGKEAVLPSVTGFMQIHGEEVHEVAVGPVHAGIIEPGHFRFQCHGERVFHLEISLGYQHRGVEKALIGGPDKRTIHYMEKLSGDTTIGHAMAYAQAVEGLANCEVSLRASVLRFIMLELERLANHTGDLGAMAGDIGYLPTMSYCGRLRGDFLNLTAFVCGNRFGRNMIIPGGVSFDIDEAMKKEMKARLLKIFSDVKNAVLLLWDSALVVDRFDETGVVSQKTAVDLGLVGVAARACGIERDVRFDFPTGALQFSQIPISTHSSGDVFARAFVRWLEIQRSVEFILEQLENLPEGPIMVNVPPANAGKVIVSMIEGWRGEICHVAITDRAGKFIHYKIVDPSFHNWIGLAMALRGEEISNFPLCNKSFNLSYCGHDL